MKIKLSVAYSSPAALAACVALAAGCATAPPAATKPEAPCAGLQSPLPAPAGYVSDFAGVLGEDARRQLEDKLARLKRQANVEMAVVTVETTGGQDIFDYSLAVACGWGVGPPEGEPGGGLLLLLAVRDRKWRIQVSDGLRSDLPDDAVKEIGGRMTPHLRAADYARALDTCAGALIARLAEKRNFQPL